MKARLTWKDDYRDLGARDPSDDTRDPRDRSDDTRRLTKRRRLMALEWLFLIAGLLALDIFVWTNSSSVLYQSYEDWAFDQSLRGLQPSVGGFIGDEARWFFNGRPEQTQSARTPNSAPSPAPGFTEPPASQGPPAARSVIGRLEIPRLEVNVIVREGADEGTLSKAVGHIPGTALPGAIGNVGLAGHRDTFFRALRNIRADDVINVETTAGTYRYLVKTTKIVTPRDVSVLNASGGETLTLVTCYPFYYIGSAPKRFIVHAAQIAAPDHQAQPSS
ncbi:MAG: class D sortase [Bryobacterales bacterium]|nr:class D sortase [Bryobacterales bacterium]